MKRKIIYLLLSLGLVLALVACGVDSPEETPSNDDKPADLLIDEDTDSDKDSNSELLAVDAYDIFIDKYPDTKVIKFQLDEDEKQYYYKIKGYHDTEKYELKLDYQTGDILKDKMKNKHDYNYDISIARNDVDKALDIVDKAMTDAGNDAILDEWTLEIEDNQLVVEVEIDYKDGNDTEITYDLNTGDIIKEDD